MYIICGLSGNMISSLFVPELLGVGPAGKHFRFQLSPSLSKLLIILPPIFNRCIVRNVACTIFITCIETDAQVVHPLPLVGHQLD